jgi:hypothetical protein
MLGVPSAMRANIEEAVQQTGTQRDKKVDTLERQIKALKAQVELNMTNVTNNVKEIQQENKATQEAVITLGMSLAESSEHSKKVTEEILVIKKDQTIQYNELKQRADENAKTAATNHEEMMKMLRKSRVSPEQDAQTPIRARTTPANEEMET